MQSGDFWQHNFRSTMNAHPHRSQAASWYYEFALMRKDPRYPLRRQQSLQNLRTIIRAAVVYLSELFSCVARYIFVDTAQHIFLDQMLAMCARRDACEALFWYSIERHHPRLTASRLLFFRRGPIASYRVVVASRGQNRRTYAFSG